MLIMNIQNIEQCPIFLVRVLAFTGSIILLSCFIPDATSEMAGHEGFINTLETDADGKILVSGSWDTTIRVWKTATHSPTLVLDGHIMSVNAVSISPSQSLLASASWDHSVFL